MSDRDHPHSPSTLADDSLGPEDEHEPLVPARADGSGPLRILGRFELLRELGRGGMGRVFKAWDPARGEQVAVKVLLGFNSSSFYRFKREFRALAEVSHPNLVKLHELFFENGRLFFSMELLEGDEFVTWVRRFEDPTKERLRPALRQLAGGIDALHQAGKLHRDIKPSNIMVTTEGRVVLLDFGLIRGRDEPEEAELTAPGAVLGTPAYMSPEQATGRRLGPESDWYSLGLVLYEALAGERPFHERNPVRLMQARLVHETRSPSSVAARVPEDLDRLCTRLLATKPEDRPSRAEILGTLGADVIDEVGARRELAAASPSARFVGRAPQLAILREALIEATSGRTVCVFVSGPSGIGKSELIHQFLRLHGDALGEPLSGRCYERESVPYKAFDTIVDAIAERIRRLGPPQRERLLPTGIDALARLFPALGRVASLAEDLQSWETVVDDGEVRARAFAALRDLFGRMAEHGPLVLTIDDLQWCDMDSVSLLLELLQPPDPPPMLLVFSHRSEQVESSPALSALLRALASKRYMVGLEHVRLQPLEEDDCVALARLLLDTDDSHASTRARAIAKESDGSPFFVGELIRYAHQQRDHGEVASERDGPTPRLDDVVTTRVGALPQTAQRLLEVVAIAGQRIEQGVALRAALGGPPDRRAIDLLRSANLVRTQGLGDRDWIEPFHDRIRECVVASLPDPTRREHHLALAESMAQSGRSDPDALATHFAQAGADDRTILHAINAGRAAARALAFVRAVEWYEVALEHLGEEDPRRLELEQELAAAHASVGHAYEAAQAYLRAAELVDAQARPQLRRRAAHLLVACGHLQEGRIMLGELLASVGLELPASGRSALLSLLATRARIALRGLGYRERAAGDVPVPQLHRIDLCWAAGHLVPFDTVLGASFFARHLLLALDAGEPGRIAPALAMEAASRFIAGSSSYEEARDLLRRAEQVADGSGQPEARAWVANSKPPVFLLAGEWAQASAHAREAANLLRTAAVGAGVSVLTNRYIELWCRYQMGDWEAIEAPLRRLLRSGGRHNPLHWNIRSLLAMPVALARDEPEQALAEFEAYAELAPDQVYGSNEVAVFSGIVASLLYLGRTDEAWEHVERRRGPLEKALRFRDPLSRATYWLARAQAAVAKADADARPRTLAAGRKALARLGKTGFRPGTSLAALVGAAIVRLEGDAKGAEALLRQASEDLSALEMKVHAAVARRRLGQLIGGERGAALVAEADARMTAQGIRRPGALARALAAGWSSGGPD